MEYLDSLKKLKQEIEEKNKNDFIMQRRKIQEIETITKQINLKYDDMINQNMLEKNKLIEKYSKIAEVIELYSTFDASTLGQVIAELVSIYKQEKYDSHLTKFKLYFTDYALEAMLIINPKKEDFYISSIDYDNTLVAFKNTKKDINFTVYTKDDISSRYPNIKYNIICNDDINNPNNLLFVTEFVDYVINYRIENNIDDISLEGLEKLKDEFISSHQIEIEEYHKNNDLTLKRER